MANQTLRSTMASTTISAKKMPKRVRWPSAQGCQALLAIE